MDWDSAEAARWTPRSSTPVTSHVAAWSSVARAANALDASKLHDAFAVAATPTGVVRLPIGAGAP